MVEVVQHQPDLEGLTLEEQDAALTAANAAAAAKQEGKVALAGEGTQRPEGVPEKFWNAEKGEVNQEALLASYAELEKTQGSKDPGKAKEADPAKAAGKAVNEAGLDMDALSAEYAKDGGLAKESLEALAKVGITSDMVDSFIAGQEAQSKAMMDEVLGDVGGEEGYQNLVGWASNSLPESDIDAFNAVLELGDQNATKLAVANLHALYVKSNGSEPVVQLGGKPSGSSVTTYGSTADLMKDMQNPEYRDNPAFRSKVADKLARSSIM